VSDAERCLDDAWSDDPELVNQSVREPIAGRARAGEDAVVDLSTDLGLGDLAVEGGEDGPQSGASAEADARSSSNAPWSLPLNIDCWPGFTDAIVAH
jgi:hypothetical protein